MINNLSMSLHKLAAIVIAAFVLTLIQRMQISTKKKQTAKIRFFLYTL